MSLTKGKILEVSNVNVMIKKQRQELTIATDVSFAVGSGEALGIVGESGCGKSITALSIMGLLPNNVYVSKGSIRLKETDLVALKRNDYRKMRGKEIAMIFQEPMTSLNPVYSIGFQIVELLREHTQLSKKAAKTKAIDMLKLVGIPRPEEVINEYPHQLSGGMRQRVMIAMGLACDPSLLIADEPTTALDVTIQAQILELLKDIQKRYDMGILLISHDLGVIAEVCDRVLVMYAGQVVEEASVQSLFENPKHPYTRGLIASTPKIGESKKRLHTIEGSVPQLADMPNGCRFAVRCNKVMERCLGESPPLFEKADHTKCRCWLYEHQ
ncbi:ABC transporter ATP-binding protein [Brevibacillus fluminis]|uniref:ABC transporter ATP-binding protein n=1 Tax=Brevibacillus fluminis TaxID=511487 RepID=A0A3M8DKQ9_9BACL|nr:ABC transporter ATP-binding protein [Brevibacillus fluminis]RNB87687.1 ABC transporter ATP-binding protein [Brevibacillus fluminis]